MEDLNKGFNEEMIGLGTLARLRKAGSGGRAIKTEGISKRFHKELIELRTLARFRKSGSGGRAYKM